VTRSLTVIGFEECFGAVSAAATVEVLDRAAVVLRSSTGGQSCSSLPAAQFSTTAGESLMFGHMGFVPNLGMCVKTGMQVPENARYGLDTVQAAVLLFDADTGVPRALIDGRAITIMRTAGALIAGIREVLGLRDAAGNTPRPPRVAVIGYGAQGRHVARLAREVLGADKVMAVNRSATSAECGVILVDSIAEAVDGADVIACATSSVEPVLSLDQVRAGQDAPASGGLVVASLNSYQPDKSELDPRIIGASSSVHLDLDDPLKFGPIARFDAGREGQEIGNSDAPPTIRIFGQTQGCELDEPWACAGERGLRTVLVGGHGIQDSLMAWSVLCGWPSVDKATRRYTGIKCD
jgi:ornithine cyclodeaminase/alanine dehydrogenase-like protein (mu-crystallin family)